VLPQLRERGRVSRGYIGVTLTNVTPALQRALDFGPASGALVQEVASDSPAARAGLRTYDVITAVDGRPIATDDELTRYISGHAPGTVSQVDVWRDGQSRAIAIKLEERPSPKVDTGDAAKVEPASRPDSPLGLSVHDLDPTTIKHLNLPDAITGVVITDVDPAGPSRVTSIRRGQVLIEINRQPVGTTTAYRAVTAVLRPSQSVAVLVYDPLLKQHAIYTITLDPQS
jgi:serine protease Do